MFGSLGFTELILILFIVLIIFGAGKLPQLGEGVGKAIKGFKKSVHEANAVESEAHHVDEPVTQAQVAPQSSGLAPDSDSGHVASPTAPTAQRDQEGGMPSTQASRPEPDQASKPQGGL